MMLLSFFCPILHLWERDDKSDVYKITVGKNSNFSCLTYLVSYLNNTFAFSFETIIPYTLIKCLIHPQTLQSIFFSGWRSGPPVGGARLPRYWRGGEKRRFWSKEGSDRDCKVGWKNSEKVSVHVPNWFYITL